MACPQQFIRFPPAIHLVPFRWFVPPPPQPIGAPPGLLPLPIYTPGTFQVVSTGENSSGFASGSSSNTSLMMGQFGPISPVVFDGLSQSPEIIHAPSHRPGIIHAPTPDTSTPYLHDDTFQYGEMERTFQLLNIGENSSGFVSGSSSNTSLMMGHFGPISPVGFDGLSPSPDTMILAPTPDTFAPSLYDVQGIYHQSDIGQLPYVCNEWHENGKVLHRTRASKYKYFVPPKVSETDYFGGQLRIFALEFFREFLEFLPDVWILQGLPELRHPDCPDTRGAQWFQDNMTCKLRFCCRKCTKPWTSMRGKVAFFFSYHAPRQTGIIYMKIFGQVCNKEDCIGQGFQPPACYPEEIAKMIWKLRQFIGYIYYGLPMCKEIMIGHDRAYREGHPRAAHVKELCQACQAGFCNYGSV